MSIEVINQQYPKAYCATLQEDCTDYDSRSDFANDWNAHESHCVCKETEKSYSNHLDHCFLFSDTQLLLKAVSQVKR